MIRRINISGYKSFREMELTDLGRLVVLFGQNASGKSNLLDAIDLLAHLAREDTVLSAFQEHRGNRLERPLPVRWFFHGAQRGNEPREMRFEVDLELQPRIIEELNNELSEREEHEKLERPYTRVTQSRVRYELLIKYDPEARALDIMHEYLAPLTKSGEPKESIVPYIYVKDDSHRNKVSVKLERQAHPRFYDLPRGRTLLSEISDAVNHPHLVATARELKSARVYYVEPARMRSTVSDIEATDPGPHGEQLASFFHWIKREHPIEFKNLVHNLGRLVPGIEEIDVREAAEGFLELWVRERNYGEFPASLISEGTLRLLCLLGIAVTPKPPAVVGYEEPENGVNPARLGEMLAILENAAGSSAGTQFLLTTHSPSVLDFFDEANLVFCDRSEEGSVVSPYKDLPLFRDAELESQATSLKKGRSKVGQKFIRGDLG